MSRIKLLIVVLSLYSVYSGFCLSAIAVEKSEDPLYTAYNVWYEKPEVMWSVNYKKGILIPAGTAVTSLTLESGHGRKGKACEFEIYNNDRVFVILFTRKYHPGLKSKDITNRLFTSQSFKQLTAGFSTLELECVKEGEVKPGIRKEAVLVAYGYPPEHLTHSIKENAWSYWITRFKRQIIIFNDNGVVEKVLN